MQGCRLKSVQVPNGWRVRYLPPGITRGLTIEEPTLVIGAGPRNTSIVTDPITDDVYANAVNLRADAALWNVSVRGSRFIGLQIQTPGIKVYLGDCRVYMNASQGAHGNADWFCERCYFEANGCDPNHDHNTYWDGRVRAYRSLFYHAGARSLGLGRGEASDYPEGSIERCVIAGLDGFYGVADIYPTVRWKNCTVIGTLCSHSPDAITPSAEDGNYVARDYSEECRSRYAHPIFRFFFPVSKDISPAGAYPFDARLTYPDWTGKWWAQSMCDVWWNPQVSIPFYAYYPLDDLDRWEAFMATPTADRDVLDLQLELHGGLYNCLAHVGG